MGKDFENSSDQVDKTTDKPQVVDLGAFRQRKALAEELGQGRKPLYVSHLNNRISSSDQKNNVTPQDFGDRLQRIRSSLDKINRLMSELKKMSDTPSAEKSNKPSGGASS